MCQGFYTVVLILFCTCSIGGSYTLYHSTNIETHFYVVLDLLPGRMYTIFVSTATSFTDQLPPEMFSTSSASDQVTTSGSSGVSNVGAIAGIVVTVVVIVIVACILVMLFCIW